MKNKMISTLCLLLVGIAALQGAEEKTNGKLKITSLALEDICYTGKPFSKELGAYVFKYRNYNPETTRWITQDPSGFPDGANNRKYAPVGTFQVDPNGLLEMNITDSEATSVAKLAPTSPWKVRPEFPTELQHQTPFSDSDFSLIKNQFKTSYPDQSISDITISGTLNIPTYHTYAQNGDLVGANITANYDGTVPNLRWVQVVHTNDPNTSPGVTQYPAFDFEAPDEYNDINLNPMPGTYGPRTVSDLPVRYFSDLKDYHLNVINWWASDYLVYFNGSSMTIYSNGFTWGWELDE